MSKNSRDKRPYIRPATSLELNQSNVKLRWILVCVLFLIAIVAFGIGLFQSLETEPGWQDIAVASGKTNCGAEFVLMYDFSEAGAGATQLNKQLSTDYSKFCEDAYAIFSPNYAEEGIQNVRFVNASVNQQVSVHPVLYEAFELLNRYGNRSIFLAPVYVEYDRVFLSESDPEAEERDPNKNPEVRAYIDEMMAYSSDEEMISLELLGNNQVRLNVHEEYLEFARKNGIEEFIDFGWMTNGFTIDYLADQLVAAGYTNGYLASYNGFTRNLVQKDQSFRQNLFDLQGRDIIMPAVIDYSGQMSLVCLRNFPLHDLDQWSTYVYGDGSTVTSLIDAADGFNKGAASSFLGYSKDYGCAELMLNLIPVYLTDNIRTEAVAELAQQNIFGAWYDNGTLYYSDSELKLEMLPISEGVYYQNMFVQ